MVRLPFAIDSCFGRPALVTSASWVKSCRGPSLVETLGWPLYSLSDSIRFFDVCYSRTPFVIVASYLRKACNSAQSSVCGTKMDHLQCSLILSKDQTEPNLYIWHRCHFYFSQKSLSVWTINRFFFIKPFLRSQSFLCQTSISFLFWMSSLIFWPLRCFRYRFNALYLTS